MKLEHVYPDEQPQLVCPHCGEEIEEYWKYFSQYDGDTTEDIECPNCQKCFVGEICWEPRFTTYIFIYEKEK